MSQEIQLLTVQKAKFLGSLIVTFSFRAVIVRVIKEQVFLLGRKFKFSRERIVAKSCSVRTLTILSRFDWIVVAQSQTKKSYNVRPPLDITLHMNTLY